VKYLALGEERKGVIGGEIEYQWLRENMKNEAAAAASASASAMAKYLSASEVMAAWRGGGMKAENGKIIERMAYQQWRW
jgi:hypothetical protein